ncbi:TetR/AcrR family transcriptional regulator [Actinacidiphila oryziradicis]|uniref:TetR/AcrR family transcriptional regulator n=1 Tax=Actinacidiphila oryziradicis TaxID=2571141 RepID=A0A4U0SNY5_9ACTN|nr:TetR/AcrR family transcriptional regulator [Actinacidiphila oryziradicis]TKA11516.1 TetR/AcrR family transcriptional regulator [Actinacidiphila oryziradicis]
MTTSPASQPQRGRYHHGELRAALIEASFELLAESGLAAFSVAQVARKLGVSTAAPYRHFPDRDHLMAAVATQAAAELAEQFRQTAERAGNDAAERFAATAGAYVRFVGTRGAGFDVIFAADLERLQDRALADAGRRLMDLLLELTQQATGQGPETSLALVGQHVAAAHGYVTLHSDGFFRRQESIDTIADLAVAASRALLRGTPEAQAAGTDHG